jgi:uncharacterized protein (DUF1501 family)
MTDLPFLPDSVPSHEQRPAGLHSGCDCGQDASFAPEPFAKGFTRRKVLAGSAALTAAFALQPIRTRMALAAPAPGEQVKTAIFVIMNGGWDSLGLFGPLFDPGYARKKGDLAIAQGAALPMGGGWGMHPNMRPTFDALWSKKLGSLVTAAGSWDETLSHFDAAAEIQGGGKGQVLGDGFVARAARNLTSAGVLSAVHRGGNLPKLDQGGSVLTLDSIQSFGLGGFDGMKVQGQARSALARMWGSGGIAKTPEGKQALDALRALGAIEKLGQQQYQPAAQYPGNDLADSLKTAAQLIKANVGLRIVTIEKGGWDTHTGQQGAFNDYSTQLGQAFAAFGQDLGAAIDRVGLLCFGEFGRTHYRNGGGGTDHGRGQAMLALGGLTTGKIVGRWPGMNEDNQDKYDNTLEKTVHMYSVFGELLRSVGVANVASLFPGTAMEKVGAFK